MAYPSQYQVSYSFAGFEAANPSTPKPGAPIDAELANIQVALADLRNAWMGMFTADGGLKPATVGTLQFDATVTAVMQAAFDAAAADFFTAVPDATTTTRGLMSAADKVALAAAGSGGGSSSTVTIGRNISGPTTTNLAATDAGKLVKVSAVGGQVNLNVPAGITTPAGSKLMGWLNKIGTGNLQITVDGVPGTAPAVVDSQAFVITRNSDVQNDTTKAISAQTWAQDFIVPTGGANCALYVFVFAVPTTNGKTNGTLGLTIEGVTYTWDATSTTGAVAAPYGPSTRFKALAMGTVADGTTIDIDIAISSNSWHSVEMFAVLLSGVTQTALLDAGTLICRTNDTATTSKTPSVGLLAGNRRMLYAAACRFGSDYGTDTMSLSGATQLENANTGNSNTVLSNLRGIVAHEAGSAGANDATFTFPAGPGAQMSAEIALAVPPPASDAMTIIMPDAGSRTLAGVNQLYGWTYDPANAEFQII